MDQNAHERLAALADIAKKHPFRLSKQETEEAASLLTQALKISLGPAHDTADTYIRALPADVTTKAIGDSWSQLSDSIKQHLLRAVPDLPRGDRFDRLKLLAGAAVLNVDPKSGTTFLCTSCTSLAPKSGCRFSGEVVNVFRKAFLEGDEPKLNRLCITSHTSSVTGALLNLTVAALLANFTQAPALDPVFQLPVVKWFFTSQAYTHLKPAQQTQLAETIKRWNTTLQGEVLRTIDTLPGGLPSGFEFLLAPPTPKPPPAIAVPVTSAPASTTSSQIGKPVPHWKDLLDELASQIARMDQERQSGSEQLAKSEAEAQALRTALASAEIHIRNLNDELGKKAEENERNAAGLSAAQAAASEATQRADALEAKIAELNSKHEERIQTLTSRIETEAAHRVESFQHSLANTLRVDYGHFQLCQGKTLTAEIGAGLQMLVSGIFDRLQRNGINVKE